MGAHRHSVAILESEIAAICRDAGLTEAQRDALLRGPSDGGDPVRALSGPVREALCSLLSLRRHLLARAGEPR